MSPRAGRQGPLMVLLVGLGLLLGACGGGGGATGNVGGTGGGGGGGTTPTPPSAQAGSLVPASTGYSVLQNAGAITVSIVRQNGSSGAVSLHYVTANGSAVAGTDYSPQSGNLSWPSGDTSARSIRIPVSNLAAFDGTRRFTLALGNVGGGATLPVTNTPVDIIGSGARPMGQAAAARLLMQGTFGASPSLLASTAGVSLDAWFTDQQRAAPSQVLPSVPDKDTLWTPFWFVNAVQKPDQLRQRMALALSELFVVSNNGGSLEFQNQAMAYYYDLLQKNALGNFRTLLEDVTLSPEMGLYLSMFRNDKPDPATGKHADENYAREVMQLFTVGLFELNPDGTRQLDASGAPIPTYAQADVLNLARVFTGWASAPVDNQGESAWIYDTSYVKQMVAYENHHDTDAKTIIGGVTVPAGGSAATDLRLALDTLFAHHNVGPFIARQLIQRLVTSNPSPTFVARVASVFDDNGRGARGDLFAVAKAILTDPEALTPGDAATGKLREPLLRVANLWRAFDAADSSGKLQEYAIATQGYYVLAQMPLYSPSVFNFFRPDYERAGAIANSDLVAPEFQITNENTAVLLDNQLQRQAYQYLDSAGKKHAGPDYDASGELTTTSVLLRTAPWETYAETPATLVDQLALVFMAGQMPAEMRRTLIDYATGIDDLGARVAETADLVVNSSQYAVQR